jgi:hypothetical protein
MGLAAVHQGDRVDNHSLMAVSQELKVLRGENRASPQYGVAGFQVERLDLQPPQHCSVVISLQANQARQSLQALDTLVWVRSVTDHVSQAPHGFRLACISQDRLQGSQVGVDIRED